MLGGTECVFLKQYCCSEKLYEMAVLWIIECVHYPSSLTMLSAFSTLHSSVRSSTFFIFTYGGSLYLHIYNITCTYIYMYIPNSQGWAPRFPIHFVWFLFVCIVWVWWIVSGFPSFLLFLYNYLSYIVCIIHMYFHVNIYTCTVPVEICTTITLQGLILHSEDAEISVRGVQYMYCSIV